MAEWVLENDGWWYVYYSRSEDRQRKKRGVTKKCTYCGSSFLQVKERRPHGRNKGIYCSRECSGTATRLIGNRSPRWKGGREIDKDGYVRLWNPRGDGTRILEHRFVMSENLGRPLARSETVHHINGDKQDNRLENLQLRVSNHGPGQPYACLDCGSHKVGPVPIPG